MRDRVLGLYSNACSMRLPIVIDPHWIELTNSFKAYTKLVFGYIYLP